jgi:uncharacterized protein (DUF433 family)
VPSLGWHATIEADQAIVSVRIGDARWRLRLKRGPQFRRQMTAFRQISKGEAIPGELAIYERSGVMVKMAAWLPRAEDTAPRADILTVRTGHDRLLVAWNAKDERLWLYNGDHLRRWIGEHRTQNQRWSEDQKLEQWPVASLAKRREAAARKFRRRMDSATHEIAAQLAGYAARRHFAQVRYDDSDHSYLGDAFPWYRLRMLIAEKPDARGIALDVSVASAPEVPAPHACEAWLSPGQRANPPKIPQPGVVRRRPAVAIAKTGILNSKGPARHEPALEQNLCFGKPCIRGSRIWVSLLLDFLVSEMTMEQILEEYPQLTRDDILASIAYGAEMSRGRFVDLPGQSAA